jgi:hypothetical protein
LCAVIQALFGQLYPATLLARLVSLEIVARPPPHLRTEEPNDEAGQ